MADQPKQTGVVSAVPSLARDVMPEGRVKAGVAVTRDFENARDGKAEDKESTSTTGGGNSSRFAEIKAECRYCGRALEQDHSL